ncbi:Alpha/beta hydrolase [uncultured Gammaproteobacteria bacterium]
MADAFPSDRTPPSAPPRLKRGTASIAYHHTPATVSSLVPTVVFFGGFHSDMTGTKATTLEAWAQSRGCGFTRFDYQGHGGSSGRFQDGAIGIWLEDALAVIDRVTQGPLVLVGSSMGGWIMLLAALARRERIVGLVGVASAPDFTEDLIWGRMHAAERAELLHKGTLAQPSTSGEDAYPITLVLIEEARNHLLLRDEIELDCPVRLIHGLSDADVPPDLSLRLAQRLRSLDVHVTLVKDGDHRLSRPEDLALLCRTIGHLLAQLSP